MNLLGLSTSFDSATLRFWFFGCLGVMGCMFDFFLPLLLCPVAFPPSPLSAPSAWRSSVTIIVGETGMPRPSNAVAMTGDSNLHTFTTGVFFTYGGQ